MYSFGITTAVRRHGKKEVLCRFLKPDKVGINRMSFLLEALQDLDNSFRARGTRLLVLKGNPVDLLPRVFKVRL